MSSHDMIVAIDIGTTKICVLIGRKITEDQCEIIGIGKAPSKGLSRGVVVSVGPAIESIKTAIQEAELMAGVTIESAHIGISGAHISAHNSSGMIPIKHGDIRATDIERVIAAAQTIPLSEGEQILHVIPQMYTIDGQQQVRNPLGMHGVRLEAQVHIITGGVTSVQNLVRCCQAAGIKVRDIILEPLASADAVLSDDEKELGVALIDIGGGTTDFAVYQNGSIRHTHILPIAGNLFTNDIALCLRTTRSDAERIKKEYGSTIEIDSNYNETYEINTVDGEHNQTISLQDLTKILQPRAHELLSLINQEIATHNLMQFMPSGIVITGGGSLLHGIHESAQELLHIPSRIGRPKVPVNFKQELNNPIYATGYGLLVHAMKKEKQNKLNDLDGPIVSRVFWKMKSWIADFF